MWEAFAVLTVILVLLNLIFWVIGIRTLSVIFEKRMDAILTAIHDGMAQRDAAFAGLKAMVTRSIVHDTKFFDDSLDMLDGEEEEQVHGREEEDQE